MTARQSHPSSHHAIPTRHAARPGPSSSPGVLAAALDTAARTGPIVVLVLDGHGTVVEVSPSLSAQLGWGAGEVTGRDSLDLVHPADRGVVYAARMHLAEDRDFHAELRVRRRQGGWRVWDTRANPAPHLPVPGAVIVTGWDVTAAWRQRQSLAHAASHDPLTQLPNRTVLRDRLRLAHARQHRSGASFGLLYLDLDGFKNVNDTHGHAAGDQLLQEVATVLSASIRGQDVAARMGGDEFAVLIEDLHSATAANEISAITTRIAEGVAALAPADGLPAVTVSVGTVIARPADLRTPDALLAAADHDMLERKNHAR